MTGTPARAARRVRRADPRGTRADVTEHSDVGDAGRRAQSVHRSGGRRQVGRALAVEVRHHDGLGGGRLGRGRAGEVSRIATEPAGERVGDLRGVEGAGQREERCRQHRRTRRSNRSGRATARSGTACTPCLTCRARSPHRPGRVRARGRRPCCRRCRAPRACPRQPELLGRRRQQRADGGDGRPHGRQPVEPRLAAASPTTVAISSALYVAATGVEPAGPRCVAAVGDVLAAQAAR